MFIRRKKSSAPPDISIVTGTSTLQSHSQTNLSPAPTSTPLYERFATTSRANTNPYATGGGSSFSSPRTSVTISRPMALGSPVVAAGGVRAAYTNTLFNAGSTQDLNAKARKSSTRDLRERSREREDLPPLPPVPPVPAHDPPSRLSTGDVNGAGVGANGKSRARLVRAEATQQRAQPVQPQALGSLLSPPTSPTLQKHETPSGATKVIVTRPKALPGPPASMPRLEIPLLSSKLSLPSSHPSSATTPGSESSYGAPTPPGASPPVSSGSSGKSSSSSSSHVASLLASPASNTNTIPAPSAGADEFGLRASPSNGEPSLGNSLTKRAAPVPRRKYSPLAAFGPEPGSDGGAPSIKVSPSPSMATSPSQTSSSSFSPSINLTSTGRSASPSNSGLSAGNTSPVPADTLTTSSASARHASVQSFQSQQCLKTNSIELRVGFNADEQAFRSPLFASSSFPFVNGDGSSPTPTRASFDADHARDTVEKAAAAWPDALRNEAWDEDVIRTDVLASQELGKDMKKSGQIAFNGLNSTEMNANGMKHGNSSGRSARGLPSLPSPHSSSSFPSSSRSDVAFSSSSPSPSRLLPPSPVQRSSYSRLSPSPTSSAFSNTSTSLLQSTLQSPVTPPDDRLPARERAKAEKERELWEGKERVRTLSASSVSSSGRSRSQSRSGRELPDLPAPSGIQRAQPPQREILYATRGLPVPVDIPLVKAKKSRHAKELKSAKEAREDREFRESKERGQRMEPQIPTPPTSVDGHSIKSGRSAVGVSVAASPVASPPSEMSNVEMQDVNSVGAFGSVDVPRERKLSSSKKRTTHAINGAGVDNRSDTVGRANSGVGERERERPSTATTTALMMEAMVTEADVHSQAQVTNGGAYEPPATLTPPQSQIQPSPSPSSSARLQVLPRSPSQTTMPLVSPRRFRSNSNSGLRVDASSNNRTPSSSKGPASPRKLVKPPPPGSSHSAKSNLGASPSLVDLATGVEMPAADPFAKDGPDIARTPVASTFAQQQGETPAPDDYFTSRVNRRGERLERRPKEALQAVSRVIGHAMSEAELDAELTPRPQGEVEQELQEEPEGEREPTFYPLDRHLTYPPLLSALLPYLTFHDWCVLTEVNDALRRTVEHRRELRETVLEHFLRTVGYVRWRGPTKEPIMLTFRDLNSYMRGVSLPSHQYAVAARNYLDSRGYPDPDKALAVQKTLLASSCRAYTRVVLRLRAQLEADVEEAVYQFTPPQSTASVNNGSYTRLPGAGSRGPSRPPSPSSSVGHSMYSQSHHGHGAGHGRRRSEHSVQCSAGTHSQTHTGTSSSSHFRSPLFRLGHAPLLRVFVPSPEGEWLSDQSVMDCEKELKRAGVLPLLRVGDIVWDAAVGDEGNVGRMVWDGNYLIDLDYTYSHTGELPQYLHTLSFPPSYFHRVVRTLGNPICYIDLSPWGEEIAANLQLLQDRVKTETPQGGHHMVVRWIHRSKFRVRPNPFTNAPIPIPNTTLSIDPGWYGSVIVETEGTNEGLADLQDRCKTGFPPRAGASTNKTPSKVFRLLRERSRPGEIWIRAVREKERLL